ncbi:ABC transporter permease [Salisediminibacterium selenitireducens]|uniref:ABC-2 type transport system permease protein n=1 Tax=Bacillus selenitireducens (strain ATCC 700615 / DSM 15326 / MLS10) TaxID=439292 RepID=D6XYB7_BACIE|nr:ABC transporter permease subunit [Salisediminibacterium selenitireducens]ADI00186.1 hypothetical protein Bsel_2688 [[Bacillus] selenitireducens MLS10]
MKQFLILFKKEGLESARNFKWLWLPVVFMILGLTQPLTSYYFADILENFGGLPEGAVFEMPPPEAAEVLAGTLSQFSQIGILVVVLAYMGTVSQERTAGQLAMVMVKPVSEAAYLLAKWLHMVLLTAIALFFGFGISVYYTHLLIGEVTMLNAFYGGLTYLLWLVFAVSLLLFLSVTFNRQGAVAFLSLGILLVMGIVSLYAPDLLSWSPGALSGLASHWFYTGEAGDGFTGTVVITLILIAALLTASLLVFKKQEMITASP